jgi:hypothetical protein
VGRGRKELSPELMAGFATVLGIAVDDLAALTGVDRPAGTSMAHVSAADVADFIWATRRLTDGQMTEVCDRARSMVREVSDQLPARAAVGRQREHIAIGPEATPAKW